MVLCKPYRWVLKLVHARAAWEVVIEVFLDVKTCFTRGLENQPGVADGFYNPSQTIH